MEHIWKVEEPLSHRCPNMPSRVEVREERKQQHLQLDTWMLKILATFKQEAQHHR